MQQEDEKLSSKIAPTNCSRRLLSVALVGCSILFALLMAEGIVRLVAPQAVQVPYHDELNGVLAARPSVHGEFAIADTFDTTISVNSQRFRGLREYSQKPEEGITRIATLGDSLTFGFGANDDETYPAQLERYLVKSLSGSSRQAKVEVINASISGAGTGDEALLFATWVAGFHPDLVILNVYANDVDDDHDRGMFDIDANGNAAPKPRNELGAADSPARRIRGLVNALPLYSFLAQHSQLLYLFRHSGTLAVSRMRASAFQSKIGGQGLGYSSRESFVREGIPKMAAEIRWLNAQVRKSGSHLVVAFLPPQWWKAGAPPEYKWKSDVMVSALVDLSARDEIPFLDVTPLVRARELDLGRSLYYQGRDEHPNPMGYEAFAEIVSQYILSQHLVPTNTNVLQAVGK